MGAITVFHVSFPNLLCMLVMTSPWTSSLMAGKKFKLSIYCDFYPSAIKAVGYSDHQRRGGRSVGRAVRNSALTKKLTDEFCLFFTDMTYVPGQFIPYIFFWHQVISGHFKRWPPKKLVSTITYEPLVGWHSNLVWLFSRYF